MTNSVFSNCLLFKASKPQVGYRSRWTPPPPESKESCWWRKWVQIKEVFPLIRTSEAMLAQMPLIPFISLMHLPSPVTGNSYFFSKKLKHKKAVKKLQTDLAIAKQEAAITVLELNEKIKTLCEGRPCPRGQYHYPMTSVHWLLFLGDACRSNGSKTKC